MQYTIPMYVFQASQGHRQPALDIGSLKDERLVTNDCFQVCIQEFEDQVHILLDREYVQ